MLIRHRQCLFFPTWGLFPYNMDTPLQPFNPKMPTDPHRETQTGEECSLSRSPPLNSHILAVALPPPKRQRYSQEAPWAAATHLVHVGPLREGSPGQNMRGTQVQQPRGMLALGARKLPQPQEAAPSKCCHVQRESMVEQQSRPMLHPFWKGSGS